MGNNSSTQIQWFFGRVTSVTAQLYLRVRFADSSRTALSPLSPRGRGAGGEGPAPLSTPHILKATLVGPRSLYARTLETSVQLTPVVGDETLWQATLEDPCFWTLRQPYVYAARVTIGAADGPPEEIVLTLGVPVLMMRDGRLELEGKNWTLRAFRPESHDSALSAACHESGTGLLVDCPSDEFCELASREGVLLIADLSAIGADAFNAKLRRLARWPAVGIAILPASAEFDPVLRQETSHVIRAQHCPKRPEPAPRDWAQVLIVPSESIGVVGHAPSGGRAIVVQSSAITPFQQATLTSTAVDPATQVALGRQACDSLQAELAGQGDFAGYLVG